jgi:hypothetical protein
MTADPNLPLLEEAASKLRPFLKEIVFVGGATLGLLIADSAGAPVRGTTMSTSSLRFLPIPITRQRSLESAALALSAVAQTSANTS